MPLLRPFSGYKIKLYKENDMDLGEGRVDRTWWSRTQGKI
jgi:hypothetical protein